MHEINSIAQKIAEKHDSDIFIFNAEIDTWTVDSLILKIKKLPQKHKNIILILTTFGGSADDAYRMVRYIKKNYEHFILFVFGSCKSAGTLIALGADEIVMSDFGELGPLDVQINKADEFRFTSGLTLIQSLTSLQQRAFMMFKDYFITLKTELPITTKTASEISTDLTIGFLAPILAQVDPLKLGEQERALNIALEYGKRICQNTETVERLVLGYVSHGFAIDAQEASEILQNVREIEGDEISLEELIGPSTRMQSESPRILSLLETKEDKNEQNNSSQNNEETEGTERQDNKESEENQQNSSTNQSDGEIDNETNEP